tara:strand:+ start:309 stop:824 length:516 start_codon:yes stop_codon:yes gene_type:complete
MTDGWMLPLEVFDWLEENIPHGSCILEFGSGAGSVILSENYQLISIEHDEQWLGLSSGNYIHAPIVPNQVSNKYSESGWYDLEMLQNLPSSVDVILIDGPPGDIGRTGILCILQDLPLCSWIIIDDTDRKAEKNLADLFIQRLSPKKVQEIESQITRHKGNVRKATVLQMR